MTTLLIASAGGHLAQLIRMLPLLEVDDDRVWVTFDTPSARSMLEGERVEFAPHANPHDFVGTVRDSAFALKILRKYHVERAISTGANLAVAFLPLCRLWGAKCEFIESATRMEGPSLAGQMLRKVPGIDLYTQHERWAEGRWKYRWSVFDGFVPKAKPSIPPVRKLLVTLGTNKTYDFNRLIHRLLVIIPPSTEVTWQLGPKKVESPGLDSLGVKDEISFEELKTAMKEADAVVSHAGTGTALTAMDVGKFPLLIPRLKSHNEHVDDHQLDTGRWLQAKGLAMSVDADDLSWNDICVSASWTIEPVETQPTPPTSS